MAELFRKDSLQKLSSTEQLDRMIPMIRPSFWLVLAGAAAVLAAGLLWGLLSGVLYFVLLLLISFGIYHTLQGAAAETAAAFGLCALGGMLGGMIS